jgi:predicted ATP-dependent endonuclease of OLD family
MRLNCIKIKNFRSIEELTITLEPRCRILVGINESGKTNILDALSLLSGDRAIIQKDVSTTTRVKLKNLRGIVR